MKPQDDDFECFDSVSVTDCTGLMPRAPKNDYEYEAYFDVMTFSPKDIDSDESSKRNIFIN